MKHQAWTWLALLCGGGLAQAQSASSSAFPYILPDTKPDRPVSVAMQRLYDDYLAPTPEANELYSTFSQPLNKSQREQREKVARQVEKQ